MCEVAAAILMTNYDVLENTMAAAARQKKLKTKDNSKRLKGRCPIF